MFTLKSETADIIRSVVLQEIQTKHLDLQKSSKNTLFISTCIENIRNKRNRRKDI